MTRLAQLLTDAAFRASCLHNVRDPQVFRFFTTRYDEWGREQSLMRESTLNRADLPDPIADPRYGLRSRTNALSFRKILDAGRSVIVNLAVPSPDTRRLLGCLLTVGMETAALARADVTASQRATTHHLILDEFSQFMAQSEESLTRMLSETRNTTSTASWRTRTGLKPPTGSKARSKTSGSRSSSRPAAPTPSTPPG